MSRKKNSHAPFTVDGVYHVRFAGYLPDGGEQYILTFKNVHGDEVKYDLEPAEHQVFAEAYAQEKRQQLADRRHIERFELTESQLNQRMSGGGFGTNPNVDTPEDRAFVSQMDEAWLLAVLSLPEVQRRRYLAYRV